MLRFTRTHTYIHTYLWCSRVFSYWCVCVCVDGRGAVAKDGRINITVSSPSVSRPLQKSYNTQRQPHRTSSHDQLQMHGPSFNADNLHSSKHSKHNERRNERERAQENAWVRIIFSLYTRGGEFLCKAERVSERASERERERERETMSKRTNKIYC